MKKQTKKKLEQEFLAAIEALLTNYDSNAIDKTRKTIRQAAKSVVKKFNKVAKSIAAKKEAVKAKKAAGKTKKKAVSSATKKIVRPKSTGKPAVEFRKPENTKLSSGMPDIAQTQMEAPLNPGGGNE